VIEENNQVSLSPRPLSSMDIFGSLERIHTIIIQSRIPRIDMKSYINILDFFLLHRLICCRSTYMYVRPYGELLWESVQTQNTIQCVRTSSVHAKKLSGWKSPISKANTANRLNIVNLIKKRLLSRLKVFENLFAFEVACEHKANNNYILIPFSHEGKK
jgi:hypothetical protein